MILGLHGPKGVGKSTLAAALASYIGRKYVDPQRVNILSFAYPIKDMAEDLVAGFVPNPTAYIHGELKEAEIPGLGVTARWVMQTLGTEWGRELIHPDIWVKHGMSRANHMLVRSDAKRIVIFDDVRFANERDAILDTGGHVIGLTRNIPDSGDGHASEKPLHLNWHVDCTDTDAAAKTIMKELDL